MSQDESDHDRVRSFAPLGANCDRKYSNSREDIPERARCGITRKSYSVLLAAIILAMISMSSATAAETKLDSIAESYVKLVLKVGLYNDEYVDYYYGPEEWKVPNSDESRAMYPFSDLDVEAATLLEQLESLGVSQHSSMRERFLFKQLTAVRAFINQLQGKHMTFDQESKALYDVVAPHVDYAHYDTLLAQLDSLLPGEGNIGDHQ